MEKRESKEAGFTLVEVLGAIIAGLVIFATAAVMVRNALNSAKVSNAQEQLSYLRISIQETYAHVRSFESISNEELISANAVPPSMLVGDSILSEWNNEITVAPANGGRSYTITMADVPQDACIKLGALRNNWDALSIGGSAVERDAVVTGDMCSDELSNTLVFEAH